MHTVSKDYLHKGEKATSWKVSYAKWEPSINQGKYNLRNKSETHTSYEEAVDRAKSLWEGNKRLPSDKEIAGKLEYVNVLSIFSDGLDLVSWRSC